MRWLTAGIRRGYQVVLHAPDARSIGEAVAKYAREGGSQDLATRISSLVEGYARVHSLATQYEPLVSFQKEFASAALAQLGVRPSEVIPIRRNDAETDFWFEPFAVWDEARNQSLNRTNDWFDKALGDALKRLK
jgi:hypothetical protein